MCWIGTRTQKWIATKDIPCKKVIGYDEKVGVYRPWIMRALPCFYSIGHLYTADFGIEQRSCEHYYLQIHKGIHCYANSLKVCKRHEYGMVVGNNLFTVGNNLFIGDKATLKPILVDCIIPRGATYYENERGEIVTNKLKLVKIYEFTDEETD